MEDLDRYIVEITRVRRNVQIYIELFCSNDSVKILTDFSPDIFKVFQRTLHDDIVLSVARLFYGDKFENNGKKLEYLTQYNIMNKHKNILTDELKKLRKKTTELLEKIDIKNYRDLKIAHNDKDTMLLKNGVIKHNIDTESISSLLEKSCKLILGLKSVLTKSVEVRTWINPYDIYEEKGNSFVKKIKNITQCST